MDDLNFNGSRELMSEETMEHCIIGVILFTIKSVEETNVMIEENFNDRKKFFFAAPSTQFTLDFGRRRGTSQLVLACNILLIFSKFFKS